jgi:transcriptional regulator with XRE-family HTH domain
MGYQRRTEVAAGEIRALLGRNRQSIQDLANSVDIPLSTLNRRLLGEVAFTVDELDAIANHFEVPITALLSDTSQRHAS